MPVLFRLFLMLCLVLLLSQCQQRYWYRVKVNSGKQPTKGSVKIMLINKAPDKVDAAFEKQLLDICKKELYKKGLKILFSDSADYLFKLTIAIDSFVTNGSGYVYSDAERRDGLMKHKRDVRAILLNYDLLGNKYKGSIWESENDLFFFDDYPRDVRRTRGMVRYTLRWGYR